MKNLKIAFLSALVIATTGAQGFGSDFVEDSFTAGGGFSSGPESSEVVNWNDELLAQTKDVIRGTISRSGLLSSVPGTLKFIKSVRAVEDSLSYSIDNGSEKYSQQYNSIIADYNDFNSKISQVIEGRTWIDEATGFASDDAAHGSVGAKGWSMEREGAGHQLKRGAALKKDVAAIYALKDKILSSIEAIDAKIAQDNLDRLTLDDAPRLALAEIASSLIQGMRDDVARRDLNESLMQLELLQEIKKMFDSGAKINSMPENPRILWQKIAQMGVNSEYNKISPSGKPVEYGLAKARVAARVNAMIELEVENISRLEAIQKEERAAREALEREEERAARESFEREEEARVAREVEMRVQDALRQRSLIDEKAALNSELTTLNGFLEGKTRGSYNKKRDKDRFDQRTLRVDEINQRLLEIQAQLDGSNA